MFNHNRFKNTESNKQYFETYGAKSISKGMECNAIIIVEQSSYCHKCGTSHPLNFNRFKNLIEMVEYFELNAEDAES
jgi:hypothetical protein